MAVCDITIVPSGGSISNVYTAVDRIIELIKKSGLKYEVGAMSTAVEGDPEALFKLAKACHEKALELGADDVLTTFRIHESRQYDDTIEGKTAKHKGS